MYNLLIIDDESEMLQAHLFFLKTHDCSIDIISNPSEALECLNHCSYDLILLDVKMKEIDGYTLCTKIKQITEAPVIFLSNYALESDQILGFHAGGTDYISKDCSLELFWARLRACLGNKTTANDLIAFPPLSLDKKRQRAYINHTDLLLTQTEFLILCSLASMPNKILSIQTLYHEIWGEFGDANPVLIQMHISRMRSKLEKAFPRHDFIETVWGKGYQFVPMNEFSEQEI